MLTAAEQQAVERILTALQALPDTDILPAQVKAKKQILRILQAVKQSRTLQQEDVEEALEEYIGLQTPAELYYLAGAIAVWNFDFWPITRTPVAQSENELKHVEILQDLPVTSGPFVTLQLLQIIAGLRRLSPLERILAAGMESKT